MKLFRNARDGDCAPKIAWSHPQSCCTRNQAWENIGSTTYDGLPLIQVVRPRGAVSAAARADILEFAASGHDILQEDYADQDLPEHVAKKRRWMHFLKNFPSEFVKTPR